ncbi:hypothetical protein AK812_SmicGene951 [Symbiodinium microadriaticum]|uniref:Uncharacterized protein n=1 Tax=Symbiodinium microadriaticum TaxID=2951 RepID=A0A1Q9F573_SYMMI|nr:hypothetical protein AK812_SmicGene951 [Symbiodinium microadriaticum]
MAASQNDPVEITRTVADLGGMEAPRYEEMTGDELAQTVADLSGMSLHEVITDGVQTSLVALHMTGGVPEDRQDLIRLATGESFVRPTAFQRVNPDPNAPGVLVLDVPLESMTGPQRIDAAMGIRSPNANAKPSVAPALAAPAAGTGTATENAPPESMHLMRERLFPHKLSRNGPVNREVSMALNKMDCGGDVRKTWNDLDKYVTLEDREEKKAIETYAKGMARVLHEAQVELAEAVFKREWSEECPILSLLMPGTRSGGLSGCRFDHPDERSNGPMSSLRLRMNSLDIGPVTNRVDECMMETGWFAMTKAERMFLTKPVWNIRWMLAPDDEKNAVVNLVNVYDWVMLPFEIGREYYQTGEIDLTRFPCHQLNGSFNALSAMRKCVQWYCQDVFPEGSDYCRLCFVVRRRDVNEAKRLWTESTSNKRMKLDNYFNRQFTDHISTQNATMVENDGDSNGKWMWKVPTEASRLSMGLITVDPDDPMDNIYNGPQLMSLSEMTEYNREATLWGMGLIEWRLMGHTMVPVKQASHDGLDPDCSTWDELYADEDGEKAHPWTVPNAAKTPKNAMTTSQGFVATATVLAHVANALNPGAEVVLRKNVNAVNAKKFSVLVAKVQRWNKEVVWNSPIFANLADRVSSGLLVRALERAGQWSLALQTFRELGAMRVELGTSAFNAAISSCALGRRWQFTLGLLQQMPAVRVPMTRSTRNAALRAFDGPELLPAASLALRLLREWQRQTLPRHLELTEHALDQAASQLELRLTNPEGASEASEASSTGGDKDFAERALRVPAGAQVAAASLRTEDADVFVHLVGSRLYGASLPQADVDLVMELRPEFEAARRSQVADDQSHTSTPRIVSMRSLLQLRRHIEAEANWEVMEMALDARRPMLRLRHAHIDAGIEVTFDQTLATLAKSELLARACREAAAPGLAAVLLLVRAWAQRRQICGQRQGYPSGYAFGLMVAYYWQRAGLLGPIQPKGREALSAFSSSGEEQSAAEGKTSPTNIDDTVAVARVLSGVFSWQMAWACAPKFEKAFEEMSEWFEDTGEQKAGSKDFASALVGNVQFNSDVASRIYSTAKAVLQNTHQGFFPPVACLYGTDARLQKHEKKQEKLQEAQEKHGTKGRAPAEQKCDKITDCKKPGHNLMNSVKKEPNRARSATSSQSDARDAGRVRLRITPQHFSPLGTTFRDVQVDFNSSSFTIRAVDCAGYAWTAYSNELPGRLAEERCKFRINPDGTDVTIILYKADSDPWREITRLELTRPYNQKDVKPASQPSVIPLATGVLNSRDLEGPKLVACLCGDQREIRFYASCFNWSKEAVSVRQGLPGSHPSGAKPSLALLWVEDPVEPGVDLAGRREVVLGSRCFPLGSLQRDLFSEAVK